MKKELLLIGTLMFCFISCKKDKNVKEGIITVSETKLSKISNIFIKNNAAEVYQGNPLQENEVYANYEFELGDYNGDGIMDLYAIKKLNTDSNSTEIHILSGDGNYTKSLLKTETTLKGVDFSYEFELGDYNNDGKIDLYAIKTQNTETNFTEVHILSGASNYRSSLLKTETALNEISCNYKFELGDYNNDGRIDLYAIKTQNTETNFTEVHVLSGASNYTSSLLKTEVVLDENNSNYEFNLEDYDNDGRVDLYAINTESNSTIINVLSGVSNYKKSLLITKAYLNESDSNYEFRQRNGKTNLYADALKRRNHPNEVELTSI